MIDIKDIERVIGFDRLSVLIIRLGSAEVFCPKKMKENHILSHAIGFESAKKLANEFGSEYLSIPPNDSFKKTRNQMILKDYLSDQEDRQKDRHPGLSKADYLGLKYGVKRGYVYKLVREFKAENKVADSNESAG